jgi:hypothetical protein
MSNPSLFVPSFPYQRPFKADPPVERPSLPADVRAAATDAVEARKSNLSIWLELAAVPALGVAAVLPGIGATVQTVLGSIAWLILPAAAALGAMMVLCDHRR